MQQSKNPLPDRTDAITLSEKNPDQLLHDIVGRTPVHPLGVNGIAVGSFDAMSAAGDVLVSIPALGLSRIAARSIIPLELAQLGQALALGFEGGDPHKPIVMGVMLTQALSVVEPVGAADPMPMDLLVDGERVLIEAEHEIELRCGEAAIVLSADGRIQLRGTYISSHASATQRILGGSVNIN